MKFIKSSNLRDLRTLEYNQSIINVVTYAKTLDVETLKIKNVLDVLETRALGLNETLVNSQGSVLTAALNILDDQRDRVVRAFRSAVKSGMNSIVAERASAAAKLFFIFNKFGNIASLSNVQETSAIRQLLDELNEEKNKSLLQLLFLENWMNELKEVNDKYSETYNNRTLELGEKQARNVSEARRLTQEAFENFCIVVESCCITEDPAVYAALVAFINNEVAQAKRSSNLRIALKKKDNEDVTPSDPTTDPTTDPVVDPAPSN